MKLHLHVVAAQRGHRRRHRRRDRQTGGTTCECPVRAPDIARAHLSQPGMDGTDVPVLGRRDGRERRRRGRLASHPPGEPRDRRSRPDHHRGHSGQPRGPNQPVGPGHLERRTGRRTGRDRHRDLVLRYRPGHPAGACGPEGLDGGSLARWHITARRGSPELGDRGPERRTVRSLRDTTGGDSRRHREDRRRFS